MSATASIATLYMARFGTKHAGRQFLMPMANLIICFQLNFAIFRGHIWAKNRLYTFERCSPERSDYTQY